MQLLNISDVLSDLHLTIDLLDEEVISHDPYVDAVARISGPTTEQLYDVLVRDRVTTASAGGVKRVGERPLLVLTTSVPDSVAARWREAGVCFVDESGNAYLRADGLHVDVRGRRRRAPDAGGARGTSRPFTPSGLKVLFALLCQPHLASSTHRDVAAASGTSIGTVHATVTELERTGHLQVSSGGRALVRGRLLLDRWVEAYGLSLAPKLRTAGFDAPDPAWWRRAEESMRAEGAVWGGETAVHLIDRHLRPGRAVIYADHLPRAVVLEFRLRKAQEDGDVEVRNKFWLFPGLTDVLAPTPLVYADLVVSGDPRQAEAAVGLRASDDLLQRIDRS